MGFKTVDASVLGPKFQKAAPFHSPKFRTKEEADAAPVVAPVTVPVHLVLPLPPSVNNLYANLKSGGRVKTAEGKAYNSEIAGLVAKSGCVAFQGRVGVRLHIYRRRRVGDIDNYTKALLDSFTGLCWADDDQVVYLESHRHDDKDDPRIEVDIWEVKP